ncbi:hypothetical protein F2Q68_00017538 [Brassica cretica]|uniref:Uncharacterized protein n=1 Tax=Brassica cretica TaxID=69181 RepID=A0A8S9H7R3_BRACR|nr:hypothetical protein F2Q68_00017538 [Brassica cretica]
MLKSLTLAKLFPQQVGTGWLMWLTKVAGEAIHGWFQFGSNGFEKLNKVINLLLKFILLSISPRYSLALQVYTTPAQHLDSTWSSPLNPTSASATTSATTSGQTSYIVTFHSN